MSSWRCPVCERQFRRKNQSHQCEPGISVDAYFANRPSFQRAAYDRVIKHLSTLGPLNVEAVSVGVLIKRSGTFAELRPKRDKLSLSVLLSRRIDDERIQKIIQTSAHRWAHFIDLSRAEDVDEEVRKLLTEAYLDSP